MRFAVISGAVALLLAVARPVRAEVVSSGAGGFQLRHVVQSTLAPSAAYQRFLAVGQWWSDSHTYAGKASNITVEARAGGCWCEPLPGGGSVRHMTVEMVKPSALLRFAGGLGPLGPMGAQGAMTVTFSAKGTGTEVVITYNVVGYAADGFTVMAKLVDTVLTEQFGRYVAAP